MKRLYKYTSGHSKRLKKTQRDQQEKIQQGSIEKFCVAGTGTAAASAAAGAGSQLIEEFQPSDNLKTTALGLDNDGLDADSTSSDLIKECHNEGAGASCSGMVMNKLTPSPSGVEPDLIDASSLEKNISDFVVSEDPALWINISEQLKEYFVNHPPKQNIELLNCTERIIGSTKRFLNASNFYRVMKDGEKLNREWLVLSPSDYSVYCYVCKLFSSCSSALATTGFNDWKHVSQRLSEHENSTLHRKAVCSLASRMKISQRIDSQLVLQYESECKYWVAVLTRVVAVVKHLSKRGLPFFGDNETLGSPHNGNFLGCLELISEFDPFLAKHLENFGNPGKGHVHYLSSSIVNEFVSLMSQKVTSRIVSQVQQSKYFSVIVDSTPDISHVDQLSFVVRYVDSTLRPVERFLSFIPIQSHGSEYLAKVVFSTLNNYNLDVMNIRGQSYDNASNMSGKYSGLQARIKEVNPLAEYIPCSAHTLNLVAMHSIESCTQVTSFFLLLQELYNFFSTSTHRWNILKENCCKNNSQWTLKSHSSTRWCADAEATKSLRKNYAEIINALTVLSESSEESAFTRHEASALSSKLQKMETLVNTIVWDTILQRLNKASKQLQSVTENLESVLVLFNSLISFVQQVRDNFDIYEQEAKSINENADYRISRKKRVPRSRFLDDSDTPSVNLSPKDNFLVTCHYPLCDALISQLTSRKASYDSVLQKFSFLLSSGSNEISTKAHILQQHYNTDLDDDFAEEYQQFSPIKQNNESVIDMLQNLHKLNMRATFPNVETALKLFITLPISNCTSERSFSLLKRLKTPLRSTLSDDKLTALTILSFENDITSELDYNDIIQEFASLKIRKKPLGVTVA